MKRMPLIYRDTPESDAIARIGYDPLTEELRIVFRDRENFPEYVWGSVYREKAMHFLMSSSKGKWYHVNLKDRSEHYMQPAFGSFRLAAIGTRIKNFFTR